MLSLLQIPNYPTAAVGYGSKCAWVQVVGADANSTKTVTPPIDLFDQASTATGLLQTATIQMVKESGSTFATVVTAIRVSNDGINWITPTSGSVTGAGTSAAVSVKGYRYLRGEVTTAEGGAATGTITLAATNDN